jgi:hypothetical protein
MPSPIIIRISATRSRSMMTNARPNFDSSSSFHCAVIAGRSGHHHKVNAPAQEQFPHDEVGLYRFSQPDIIGNKKIDARQAQRLAERKQLIRVEPDPGAKRRLKEVAVGCRCRVPSDGANVRCGHLRCEHLRSVRRTAADLCQPLSSRLCGLISASHKTSRLSPWASSEMHVRPIVRRSESPASAVSTSHRRPRNLTKSPTSGISAPNRRRARRSEIRSDGSCSA